MIGLVVEFIALTVLILIVAVWVIETIIKDFGDDKDL